MAQEMGKWAESVGKGDMFHKAVFHAYFAQGENIAETKILVNIANSVNLNKQRAHDVILQRPFKKEVDLDWTYSSNMGITAIPTFIFGKKQLIGAQSYESLKKLVQNN